MSDQEKLLRFLCFKSVCEMTGLGRTSLYTLPDFPRPLKIGGIGAPVQGGSRWVESEVLAWMRMRVQMRDGQVAKKRHGG